jgi:estrogen-related receptor beta like 1
LEELEKKTTGNNEKISKLTNELTELSEKLDELKETVDPKDSSAADTSPLVRIKAALQQIKSEINAFDLRTGVVSHILLQARVSTTTNRRLGAAKHAKRRHKKNRKAGDNSSDGGSGDDL